MSWFTNRYMFLWVIVHTDTESGGSFWPLLFSRTCASLIFSHITLIGTATAVSLRYVKQIES